MLQVGAAEVDLTPRTGLSVAGQMRVRVADHVHDPVMATAVAFAREETMVALVSCDLALLPDEYTQEVQRLCQEKHGIPARNVLIHCTHTHVAPNTIDVLPGWVDAGFMADLQRRLVAVVGEALDDLGAADVYAGNGHLEHMGWNRRGKHGDRTDMYYGAWREGFEGVEGPRDGHLGVVFCRSGHGRVKAILTSFSTHPNAVEGESFYSADIVGTIRSNLKRVFGDACGCCYFTGASGNTAPSIMEANERGEQPWRGEAGLERSGWYMAGEVMKVIAAEIDPMADDALAIAHHEEPIPIRPWPEDFDARELEGPRRDWYLPNQESWPERLKSESPWPTRLNVVRIGEAAICTNPAELYVEHGLAVKEKSPVRVTLIAQLTDGYCGYVPTQEAFKRGGYSTWPARSSQLVPEAGDVMVEKTRAMLGDLF